MATFNGRLDLINSTSLDLACFKYQFIDLNHIHLAIIDCSDVYAAIMIRANATGGTWSLEYSIPVLKYSIPELNLRVSIDPETTIKHQLAYLKRLVRSEQQNMDIVQLDACDRNGNKIQKSITHLWFNQGESLFDPVRDGWTVAV